MASEKFVCNLNNLRNLLKGMDGVASAAEVGSLRWAIEVLEASDDMSVPIRLTCPDCGELHVDEGIFATKLHHTHSCQHCGMTWRPAVANTVGVRFLPGFKNEESK